jgi:hypothetical protein
LGGCVCKCKQETAADGGDYVTIIINVVMISQPSAAAFRLHQQRHKAHDDKKKHLFFYF